MAKLLTCGDIDGKPCGLWGYGGCQLGIGMPWRTANDDVCPPVAALLECRRERDAARAIHKTYLDQIEPILDDIREKRHTGEPAQPDWIEIRRLRSRFNAAEADLDKAKARIAEMDEQVSVEQDLNIAWQNRATKAEAERDRLRKALAKHPCENPTTHEKPSNVTLEELESTLNSGNAPRINIKEDGRVVTLSDPEDCGECDTCQARATLAKLEE